MIDDRTARRIACDWHGGGGSALYALCSTGAIDTGRRDHSALDEIRDDIAWCYEQEVGATEHAVYAAMQDDELRPLMTYVVAHGPRGPVDGWGNLTW